MSNRPQDWSPPPVLGTGAEGTVVIASADRFTRTLLSQWLQSSGCLVLEAPDGPSAFRLVRERHPDVLIAESGLPTMHGEELCRRIKSDPITAQTFVILITDLASANANSSLDSDTGPDERMAAPCDGRELISRTRAGMRVAELQKFLSRRNEEYQSVTSRLNQELSVVASIQKAMLPQAHPTIPGFEFSSFYLPSTECGGDYYDLHQLDDERLAFVIADVSGHGAPAMVAMALIRQNFHLIADRFGQPHELLIELNRMLYDHLPTDQYATMLYAIINTTTLVCDYCSAGHNPPFWYRHETGRAERLPRCEGFPLKLVTRNASYESHSIQLSRGDKLIFYTDGIPECFNTLHELYGMDRFEQTIQANAEGHTTRQLETAIVTDVMCFADNHPQEDDLTLAIVGVS